MTSDEKKIALYIRSASETGHIARRDDHQSTMLRDLCADKPWEIVAGYRDTHTAGSDKQPALVRLLADATGAIAMLRHHSDR